LKQRKTTQKWIDNIMEDLKAYNVDMRTATDLSKDRTKWRNLVSTS